jgi:hypothetical protein
MDYISKLNLAKSLIVKFLTEEINEIAIRKIGKEMKITLYSGITIFIIYTPYNEYSYTIKYSGSVLDRVRFDNFDDKWPVKTKPHHVHHRYEKDAVESPMQGLPDKDIPILITYIHKYQ